jgi:hypothetical protein
MHFAIHTVYACSGTVVSIIRDRESWIPPYQVIYQSKFGGFLTVWR